MGYELCAACSDQVGFHEGYRWYGTDPEYRISNPPRDLAGSVLCNTCYRTLGRGLESAIRAHGKSAGHSVVEHPEESIHTCSCGWETPYPIVVTGEYRCQQCRMREACA
jgi:hypothetical protein